MIIIKNYDYYYYILLLLLLFIIKNYDYYYLLMCVQFKSLKLYLKKPKWVKTIRHSCDLIT